MRTIKVNNPFDEKNPESISLREAVAYAEGKLKKEVLTAKQLDQIEEDGEPGETRIVLCQDTSLSEVLTIGKCQSEQLLVMDGNGFLLSGQLNKEGILVERGNICLQNVGFRNFKVAVFLAAKGEQQKIVISKCTFQNNRMHDILSGGIESGSRMKDIRVVDCDFYPQAMIPVFFSACLDMEGGRILENCYLEHVIFANNRIMGRNGNYNRQGLLFYGAADMINMNLDRLVPNYESTENIRNCIARDLEIVDNFFDQVGDCTLGFCTASPGVDCALEDIVIRHNVIRQNLGAIGIWNADLMWGGECRGNILRNVVIEDNFIYAAEFDKKESIQAILVNSSRIDWKSAQIQDNHVSDIFIRNNEIHGTDGGILVEAMHGVLDAPQPSVVSDNTIRNVVIEKNEFFDCKYPVRVFGANTEGRYETLGGVTHVDDPDMEYSTLALRNSVDRVRIRENYARGFDLFLIAAGAQVCGHTWAKENTVGEDVIVEGNVIRRGRNIYVHKYYISDEILIDDAIGTDNKILCDPKFYFTGEE